MNQVSELVKEISTNEIEYKKIGDLIDSVGSARYRVKSTNYNNNFKIPVLTAGKSFILGYTNEENGIYEASKESPVMIFDIITAAIRWVDFPFKLKSSAIRIFWNKTAEVNFRFIYYSMRNLDYKITASNYQSHWEAYSQIEIPLPSLEIQNKIVSILDEFSRLEARNKQYNYYLHHLLNFEGEKSDNTEWIKLDDLIDYIQPTKFIVKSDEYKNQYETPVLTAGKTFVLGYTNEKEGIYNASKENPVIIFDDFTTSMHWVDFDFKIKSSAMKILVSKNNKNNFRYIYYAMKVIDYEISKSDHQRHWISKYSQIEIPVPSLEEQNRIVNILDKFSKLTSDINEGLPAEIKMRRQQYEYYREKLLTFSQ